jgi:hypothetical protein
MGLKNESNTNFQQKNNFIQLTKTLLKQHVIHFKVVELVTNPMEEDLF